MPIAMMLDVPDMLPRDIHVCPGDQSGHRALGVVLGGSK